MLKLLLFQHRMMSYTSLCNGGLSGYVVEHSKDIAKTWGSRGTAAPQIKKESAPKPIWFQITAQTFGSVSLVYPTWPCRHYKSEVTLACWKKKKKNPACSICTADRAAVRGRQHTGHRSNSSSETTTDSSVLRDNSLPFFPLAAHISWKRCSMTHHAKWHHSHRKSRFWGLVFPTALVTLLSSPTCAASEGTAWLSTLCCLYPPISSHLALGVLVLVNDWTVRRTTFLPISPKGFLIHLHAAGHMHDFIWGSSFPCSQEKASVYPESSITTLYSFEEQVWHSYQCLSIKGSFVEWCQHQNNTLRYSFVFWDTPHTPRLCVCCAVAEVRGTNCSIQIWSIRPSSMKETTCSSTQLALCLTSSCIRLLCFFEIHTTCPNKQYCCWNLE